jgi:hypothetical protein
VAGRRERKAVAVGEACPQAGLAAGDSVVGADSAVVDSEEAGSVVAAGVKVHLRLVAKQNEI